MKRLEARWYSSAPPPLALRPLAALYGVVAAYRRATTKPEALPVPVVVVGNISVGGTGKTPVVLWLVERLREWGWKPGVISRGYGGQPPQRALRVTADTPAAHSGDEPALLARRLGCPVAVDADRIAAARLLIEQDGVDVLVSDDGLQHHRLPRALELCVVDGARGLGNAALLPAGPLREPPERLRDMDLVLINGGDWSAPADVAQARFQLALGDARSLEDDSSLPLAQLRGQSVHAVAGIGHPARFFAALRAAGVEVIEHAFPDHHPFTASDLGFGDALPVLMTEKDAVKCRGLGLERAFYVPVEACLGETGTAAVRKLVQSLRA